MSFKRDGDDLDMLRRLKVVYLCFGIKELAAEFVSWWRSTRKQFLFYLPLYTFLCWHAWGWLKYRPKHV